MISIRHNLYLAQFSTLFGDEIYLPYSVGTVWAYARTRPTVESHYRNRGFIFVREDPEEIASSLDDPGVVAFSTYVWNFEQSVATARSIKQRHPDCLIVFGGPHVPDADRLGDFCDRHPFIDIAVHGEGEITFAEVLEAHALGGDYLEVPGITYRGVSTPPRPRTRDLTQFPSPYLSGVFDELFETSYKFHAVYETNRGCPYGCTFCDWGSMTNQKLSTFMEERLCKEIDLLGDRRITHVYLGDANFGILPRDVQLAEYFAKTKRRTGGYPQKVRINYAKNSSERVRQIARILNAEKLDKGITLSVQSMDDHTLKIIDRKNLEYETLSGFIREYQRDGIETYTEIILGLPGETLESFRRGIETLLAASAHDSLWIYRCTVLPNAPMNDRAYREEHGIKTIRTPITLNHSKPGSDPVQEYELTVCETATMSRGEYKRAFLLSWAVQLYHGLALTQVVAVYANLFHDLPYTEFYDELLRYSERHPDTMVGMAFAATRDKLDEVLEHGGDWAAFAPQYSELIWPLEEASYLRLNLDLERFYEELELFLDDLAARGLLRIEPILRADMMRYQKAIVIKWKATGSTSFEVRHSVRRFHKAVLTGDPDCRDQLRPGRFRIEVSDPYDFQGDAERYAREIVFWGRRGGSQTYQTVGELELVRAEALAASAQAGDP